MQATITTPTNRGLQMTEQAMTTRRLVSEIFTRAESYELDEDFVRLFGLSFLDGDRTAEAETEHPAFAEFMRDLMRDFDHGALRSAFAWCSFGNMQGPFSV